MPKDQQGLGNELVDAGLISNEQLAKVVEYQQSLGGSVGQIAMRLGFADEDKLFNFMEKRYGMPTIDLGSMVIPTQLVKTVPWGLIKKHEIFPFHKDRKTLSVATADPSDFEVIEELQFQIGMQVELHLAKRSHIIRSAKDYHADLVKQAEEDKKSMSQGKLRPASQATLDALKSNSETGMVEEIRSRSEGKLNTQNLTKGELREALIPALIKKGVITRTELFDAVCDLLVKKDVIDQATMREILAKK